MDIKGAPFTKAVALAAGILTVSTLSITGYVNHLLSGAMDQLLRQMAEDTSRQWASFFNAGIPDIETAYETRELTDEQLAVINNIVLFGDVFRFKMFAADGSLFFVSDEGIHNREIGEDSSIPRHVIATGNSDISLKDGRAKSNRPDDYAEAYVVAHAPWGEPIGAMEIYSDQTRMRANLEATFQWLGVTLPLFAALIYLVPTAASFVLSSQKKHREKSLAEARRDPLTGYFVRRAFMQEAEKIFGQGRPVGLIFIDIDRFKSLNDTYGHTTGDEILRIIARRVARIQRSGDLLGRVGGDEFVAVLPGIDEDALRRRIETLYNAMATPMRINERDQAGSISMGACLVDTRNTTLAQALELADAALYDAKEAGRGRAVLKNCDSDHAPSITIGATAA